MTNPHTHHPPPPPSLNHPLQQPTQVIDNTVKWMRQGAPGQQTVWRAKFSAISAPELKAAMVR